jgi:hypothetical protein
LESGWNFLVLGSFLFILHYFMFEQVLKGRSYVSY